MPELGTRGSVRGAQQWAFLPRSNTITAAGVSPCGPGGICMLSSMTIAIDIGMVGRRDEQAISNNRGIDTLAEQSVGL